jgi:hypothetical protein
LFCCYSSFLYGILTFLPGVVASILTMSSLRIFHCFHTLRRQVTIPLCSYEGTGHDRRYSLPTARELAALTVGELTLDACRFDVVVKSNMGYLEQISPLNPSLMTQDIVLFHHSYMGFHIGINYVQDGATPGGLDEVYLLWSIIVTGFITWWVNLIRLHAVEGFLSRLRWTPIHVWIDMRSETYQATSDVVGKAASTEIKLGCSVCALFKIYCCSMVQNYQDRMDMCR